MSVEGPEKRAESDANRIRFATGPELHARLARDGAPEACTLRSLAPTRQARIRVADALAARPNGDQDGPRGRS